MNRVLFIILTILTNIYWTYPFVAITFFDYHECKTVQFGWECKK